MMEFTEAMVLWTIMLTACVLSGLIGNMMGWRSGRKIGQREGFQKYVRQLRFERRMDEPIIPTGQPHSRNPKGRARVTEAHMSQIRRQWLGD